MKSIILISGAVIFLMILFFAMGYLKKLRKAFDHADVKNFSGTDAERIVNAYRTEEGYLKRRTRVWLLTIALEAAVVLTTFGSVYYLANKDRWAAERELAQAQKEQERLEAKTEREQANAEGLPLRAFRYKQRKLKKAQERSEELWQDFLKSEKELQDARKEAKSISAEIAILSDSLNFFETALATAKQQLQKDKDAYISSQKGNVEYNPTFQQKITDFNNKEIKLDAEISAKISPINDRICALNDRLCDVNSLIEEVEWHITQSDFPYKCNAADKELVNLKSVPAKEWRYEFRSRAIGGSILWIVAGPFLLILYGALLVDEVEEPTFWIWMCIISLLIIAAAIICMLHTLAFL